MTANRLPIPTLTPLVMQALRARAADFGLRAERVGVEYVLNWGGFGTASYHAGDGRPGRPALAGFSHPGRGRGLRGPHGAVSASAGAGLGH